MKTLIGSVLAALTLSASVAFGGVAAAPNPDPPVLAEILKRPNPQVIIFQPVTLLPGHSLNVTHIRMGDGSVRPGAAVQLVIYSSVPDQAGTYTVLSKQFVPITKDTARVVKFDSFVAPGVQGGATTSIIAVLIGLREFEPGVLSSLKPTTIPPQDIVSAQITDGTSVGMLVPAVQKVRSAAAR